MNTRTKACVVIVTALACEARVFIDHYRLKQCQQKPFCRYANADQSVILIVSGVGRINAAIATSHVISTLPDAMIHLINVGIAGSATYRVGECVMVHKIHDVATQASLYPHRLTAIAMPSDVCQCYDTAQTTYQSPLIDMESAGIYYAAVTYLVNEQVIFLKMVSDNESQPVTSYKQLKQDVMAMMNEKQSIFIHAVDVLLAKSFDQLSRQNVEINEDRYLSRWHFTQYQQHQLKELLRRYVIVSPQSDPFVQLIEASMTSAEEVLAFLYQQLEAAVY